MNEQLIVQNAMRSLFDNMHAYVFLKDLDNRNVKVSESVAAIHGLSVSDMEGRHSRDFYGDYADQYYKDDLEVIRTGKPKLRFTEALPVNGQLHWIEVSKVPVRDENGEIVGILVVANDVTEKRQAEQELEESRSLLQTVVDNFPQTVAFYDSEKRFQFGNPALWRMHTNMGTKDAIQIGASIEEISRNLAAVVIGDSSSDAADDFVDRFQEPFRNLETKQTLQVGSHWLERVAYPTPDGGILVITNDVTDKMTVEQELEDSRSLMQTVVDNFTESLALYDKDNRLTFLNPAMRKFHETAGTWPAFRIGATAEELGQRIAEIQFGSSTSDEAKRYIETFLTPFREPYKMIELQLGDRWVERRTYPTPGGGKLSFLNDITDRRKAEQALRDSEARYQSLAMTAQVGIFRTTTEGICTYTNELWHEITGIDPASAHGLCWTEILHPDDQPGVQDRWHDAVLQTGTFNTEVRIDRDDGAPTWVLATIANEKSEADGDGAFVGTLTDISRLKRTEARLRQAQSELRGSRDQLEDLVEQRTAALRNAQQNLLLQERLAAIGQLTATVSHELRNPLGTIVNSFAALKQRFDLSDEKAERVVGRIDRNLRRCETIIEDLLDYTRVKSLGTEMVDIDVWLAQFINDYERPADIEIRSKLAVGREIRMDRVRMAQVMNNLFDNAIDAMSDPPMSDLSIEVESKIVAGGVTLLCRDSGPGLDAALIERVFEPLVSTKTFGVGLGLPLVRQIIELHGGTVEIQNRKRGGAEVVIELPIESNKAAAKGGGETSRE